MTLLNTGSLGAISSGLTNAALFNTGRLFAVDSSATSSWLTNTGRLRSFSSDLTRGALFNTGRISAYNASVDNSWVTNTGRLRLHDANIGSSLLFNTGSMNLHGSRLGSAWIANTGRISVYGGGRSTGGAGTTPNQRAFTPVQQSPGHVPGKAPNTGAPRQSLGQPAQLAPGGFLNNNGRLDLSKHDLSGVRVLFNTGNLTINGSLPKGVQIINSGTITVRGGGNIDASSLFNSGRIRLM